MEASGAKKQQGGMVGVAGETRYPGTLGDRALVMGESKDDTCDSSFC